MRQANSFRVTTLMALLTVVLFAFGFVAGGPRGALFALVVSIAANLFTYYRTGKFALKRLGARKVTGTDSKLYQAVRKVCRSASAPEPEVYIISSKAPNALAVGRTPASASLAVTEGLLETLNTQELEGVIGHEIAHIIQRDTLLNTFAASLAGAIGWLAGSMRFSLLSQSVRRSVRGGGALFPIMIASALAPVAAALNLHRNGLVENIRMVCAPKFQKHTITALMGRMLQDSFERGDTSFLFNPRDSGSLADWQTSTVRSYRYTHFARIVPKAQMLRLKHCVGTWIDGSSQTTERCVCAKP
ncbi:MAG: M48 family metalloprotease [Planctomycetes bacterium]|nr:M48 family metalloprotease [Planctomycetota bacterium]